MLDARAHSLGGSHLPSRATSLPQRSHRAADPLGPSGGCSCAALFSATLPIQTPSQPRPPLRAPRPRPPPCAPRPQENLLRELDSGFSALPEGSAVTFVNAFPEAETLGRVMRHGAAEHVQARGARGALSQPAPSPVPHDPRPHPHPSLCQTPNPPTTPNRPQPPSQAPQPPSTAPNRPRPTPTAPQRPCPRCGTSRRTRCSAAS
jgi:hypothetical protein